jgi:hypothetical protein
MATSSYKVLGQSNPAATTFTTLYTAPASTSTICSTLVVCALSDSTTFRIAVRPGGTTLANQHYIIYDSTVNQFDSVFLTLGITLGASDVITVYAGSANVAFSLYGTEIA